MGKSLFDALKRIFSYAEWAKADQYKKETDP